MAEDLLNALSYCQENRMLHSNVRPELIEFPINGRVNFKLLDNLNNQVHPNQIQLLNINNNKDLYMSPILFNNLLNQETQIKHNPYKSDVFSVGLILLEAGLLQSVQSIYDFDNKKISENELVDKVEQFIEKYPEEDVLHEILMVMLEFTEDLRLSPNKLLIEIRRFKEEFDKLETEPNEIEYSILQQINFTSSGYQLKNDQLVERSGENTPHQRSLVFEIKKKLNDIKHIENNEEGVIYATDILDNAVDINQTNSNL